MIWVREHASLTRVWYRTNSSFITCDFFSFSPLGPVTSSIQVQSSNAEPERKELWGGNIQARASLFEKIFTAVVLLVSVEIDGEE